jgi:hypothetical protein
MNDSNSQAFTTADTRDPESTQAESCDLEIHVPKLSQLLRSDSLQLGKPQSHKSEGQHLSCSASLSDPQSPSSVRSGASKDFDSGRKKTDGSSSRCLAATEQKKRHVAGQAETAASDPRDSGEDFFACEIYSSNSEVSSRSESKSSLQQRAESFRVNYSLNYRTRFFSRVFRNNKILGERIFANKKAQTGTAC